MKKLLMAAGLAAMAAAACAQDAPVVTYETDQSFDDAAFGLESAILDAGLVIDHVSHVGEMLERTRADVGSEVVLYGAADVFSFCSAQVSRQVMEADRMNLMYCPYTIFVMTTPDNPDAAVIGYRTYPDGPMDAVEALLDGIARSAAGLD